MSDRKYPDIDFVETDTETIESNLIALYENMVQQVPGRERYKVYPASPERLFIAWVANIIVQQRVIINETAKRTCHVMRTVNTWTACRIIQGLGKTASKSGVCNVSLLYFRSTETISDYSCGHQNFF